MTFPLTKLIEKIKRNRNNFLYPNKTILIYLLFIFATLSVLLPAFFQPHHFFQNMEPYPDGLIYNLSARNFTQGHGLGLAYQDYFKSSWVGPLYAVSQIPGYIFFSSPKMFYLTNTFFIILSLFLLLSMSWRISRSKLIVFCTGIIFLSHAYILWLPNVPMAENLSILLFLIGCHIGLFTNRFKTKEVIYLVIVALLLVLTKYSMIGTSLVFAMIAIYKSQAGLRKKLLFLTLTSALIIFILPLFSHFNPTELLSNFLKDLFTQRNSFFSTHYIPTNSLFYARTFLGMKQAFLWQTTPLTMMGIFVIPLTGFLFWRRYYSHDQKKLLLWLMLLLFSQFPLMLLFYTPDTRYIILTIPILILVYTLILHTLIKHKQVILAFTCFFLSMIIQGYTQLPLFKEIIVSNLLGRSHGWQAESVRQLHESMNQYGDSTSKSQTSFLITALPPFLYDAYASNLTYRLLPLSLSQEFASKGEWVWGSSTRINPITNVKLRSFFHLLLEQNNRVFITNAYITHSHEVISDYEQLKNEFELFPLNEGCQHTCDLFELKLKK